MLPGRIVVAGERFVSDLHASAMCLEQFVGAALASEMLLNCVMSA